MQFKRAGGRPGRAGERGTTLIEAMVAMVVLSVGLLGMAGLQANALRLNQTSLQRSQASILAYEIGDLMRADSQAAKAGDYNGSVAASSCSDADADDDEDSGAAPSFQESALQRWSCNLSNGLGSSSSGEIEVDDEGVFEITVTWTEAEINLSADGDPISDDAGGSLIVNGRL